MWVRVTDGIVMNVQDESVESEVPSVYWEAHCEAERHKWIESQKIGHDLGEGAIKDWYRNYWNQFCRCKRFEHLQGRRRWKEFLDEPFGRLNSLTQVTDPLIAQILDQAHGGQENLSMILWARGAWAPHEPRARCALRIGRQPFPPRSRACLTERRNEAAVTGGDLSIGTADSANSSTPRVSRLVFRFADCQSLHAVESGTRFGARYRDGGTFWQRTRDGCVFRPPFEYQISPDAYLVKAL